MRGERDEQGPGKSAAWRSFPLQPCASAAQLLICTFSDAAAKRETQNSRPRGRAAAKRFCVWLQRAAVPGHEGFLPLATSEARRHFCAAGQLSWPRCRGVKGSAPTMVSADGRTGAPNAAQDERD